MRYHAPVQTDDLGPGSRGGDIGCGARAYGAACTPSPQRLHHPQTSASAADAVIAAEKILDNKTLLFYLYNFPGANSVPLYGLHRAARESQHSQEKE